MLDMARSLRIPPFHALIAFECAARLGGFAPAAQELCITASAVSHRIRLLESHVGEQLFERSAVGVRLSDAGQRYLGRVKDALEKLALLSQEEAPAPLRVRVGSPPTFARNLLIPRLPEFYRAWPDISVDVSIAAPTQVRPDRHDVDVRFGEGKFDERPAAKLFDDMVVVLAAPELTSTQQLLAPADLCRIALLRSPLVPWRPWFGAAGLDWSEPHRGPAFTDLGILLEAAASGLGVAVSPQRIAERWISAGQLIRLFDVTVPAASTYYTLIDSEQAQRPEVEAFVGWLHEALA